MKIYSRPQVPVITANQLQELKKCHDPVYFLNNYVRFDNPAASLTYLLYQYQEDYVKLLDKEEAVINCSARGAGLTSVTGAYSLWEAMFKPNQRVVISAPYQAQLQINRSVIDYALNALPTWLKPKITQYRSDLIRLDNGSDLRFIPLDRFISTVKGMTPTRVHIDNMAWADDRVATDVFYSVIPMRMMGTRLTFTSSANRRDHIFYRLWQDSLAGKSAMTPIGVTITEMPQYGAIARSMIRGLLSEDDYMRDYERVFL